MGGTGCLSRFIGIPSTLRSTATKDGSTLRSAATEDGPVDLGSLPRSVGVPCPAIASQRRRTPKSVERATLLPALVTAPAPVMRQSSMLQPRIQANLCEVADDSSWGWNDVPPCWGSFFAKVPGAYARGQCSVTVAALQWCRFLPPLLHWRRGPGRGGRCVKVFLLHYTKDLRPFGTWAKTGPAGSFYVNVK